MKRNIIITIFLVVQTFVAIRGECDQCHTANPVACHNETTYSLCLNGKPTLNYVSCPTDFVCTRDVFVCYPSEIATPSCVRNETTQRESTNCGVCGSKGKVFACLNETTIAFCFGDDEPHYESLSYCPEGTVCDLNSGNKFCTDKTLAEPSCKQSQWEQNTTTVTTNITSPTTITTSKSTASSVTPLSRASSTITTPAPSSAITSTSITSVIGTTTVTAPTTTTPTTTTPTTTTTARPITTTTGTAPTTTTMLITTTTSIITTEAEVAAISPQTLTATLLSTTIPTPSSRTPSEQTTTIVPEPRSTTDKLALTAAEICEENGIEGATPQPDDLSCKGYIICSKSASTWIAEVALCPTNQWFDPILALCSGNYKCPTMSTDSTTSYVATTAAPVLDTTSTTIETTTIITSPEAEAAATSPLTFATSTTTSAPSTTTRSELITPEPGSTTDQHIETAAELCEENGVEGFMPQSDDLTCKSYIICSKSASTWIAVAAVCPTNQWFDPTLAFCSGNYKCPTLSADSRTTQVAETTTADPMTETTTTTTAKPTTTTLETTTPVLTTTTTGSPLTPVQLCEMKGKQSSIAQPNDATCKSYIVCSKPASSWVANEKKCGTAKLFDPDLGKCSGTYTCPT